MAFGVVDLALRSPQKYHPPTRVDSTNGKPANAKRNHRRHLDNLYRLSYTGVVIGLVVQVKGNMSWLV
jgi:hypothetical protein